MSEYCVVVADASRARLFTLERAKHPAVESGPNLKELKSLLNADKELPKRDLYSNTRGGANRASGTGARATDDHRERHAMEREKRFARIATTELRKLVAESGADHVVLCASARMLGFLRKEFSGHNGVELHDVPRDMTKMAPAGIHAHLAKTGLLPALQKHSRAWRTCAQRSRTAAKA